MSSFSKVCLLAVGVSAISSDSLNLNSVRNLGKQGQPSVSGLQKVIKLLADMKQSVETETIEAGHQADEYEDQCIEDQTKLEGDIKYQTEKAEEHKAHAENQAAKAAGYQAEVDTLIPEIATLGQEKDTAKKVRKDQEMVFRGEEAELVEANTVLIQAYSILKRELASSAKTGAGQGEAEAATAALIQISKLKMKSHKSITKKNPSPSQYDALVQAIGTVVNSVWMDSSTKQHAKAFIESVAQQNTDPLDALRLSFGQQPAAAVKSYETRSNGILEAIADLQEKTAQALTKLRENDLSNKHRFELLVADLTAQGEAKDKAVAMAKQQAAECGAASGTAAENHALTEEAVDAATKELQESKVACHKAAEDWKARKASAADEVVVLQSAIDILNGKFGASLLQTVVRKNKSSDPREEAASMLRELGRKFNQMQFMQAATSAEVDPFTKVRKMIQDMIVKLEEQATQEATKEAKCNKDIKEGQMQVKVKGQQMKQLQARSDAASASFTQLGIDITDLGDEVKNLEAMRSTWTKERAESRANNEATVKEAAASVEALNQAIGVLQDFYNAQNESFLQTSQPTPKTDQAGAIVEMLLTAQSDFQKLRQQTESAERDAQSSYEKQQQTAEVSVAKKRALIEGKTKERAAFKVQMVQIDEDLQASTEAFSAAGEYLKSRQEACANKAMTFEERQAARQQEIEGLRTAMAILSGEEPALVQTKKISFLKRQ